jgi:hypothetical protein
LNAEQTKGHIMSELRFRPRSIKITIGAESPIPYKLENEQKVEIPAICCDVFAVHPYDSVVGKLYKITHIPSGWAVCAAPSLPKAKEVVKTLVGSGIDWTNMTPRKSMNKSTRAKARKLAAELNEQGLIIAVEGRILAAPVEAIPWNAPASSRT